MKWSFEWHRILFLILIKNVISIRFFIFINFHALSTNLRTNSIIAKMNFLITRGNTISPLWLNINGLIAHATQKNRCPCKMT